MRTFFRSVYGLRDAFDVIDYGNKYLREIAEGRDWGADVRRFLAEQSTAPPKTQFVRWSTLKSFFRWAFYDDPMIEGKLTTLGRGIRRVRRVAVSEKAPIDKDDIMQLLQVADVRMRAVILCLASTGCRVGELLQLRMNDVELDKKPPVVHIRREYAKNKQGRMTFLTEEAKSALEAWLAVRDQYLKVKGVRKSPRSGEHYEVSDDDRIFPYALTTIEQSWARMVEKIGYDGRDRETGRRVYRLHSLRSWFRKQVASVVGVDIAEALMGHEGYLTGAYRQYSKKELAEAYLKAEDALTVAIVDRSKEIRSLAEKNRELERRIRELEAILRYNRGDLEKYGAPAASSPSVARIMDRTDKVLGGPQRVEIVEINGEHYIRDAYGRLRRFVYVSDGDDDLLE